MYSITVLMSTFNGEKYIKEQIDSLLKQKNVEINIFVRDDGSTDSTVDILNEYQNKNILKWYTGENLRPAKSFMNLIMNAPECDYYAFCDQDDVWNEDKLERAVKALESQGDTAVPRLYCSNYQLVDAKLNDLPDNGHVSTITFEASLVSSCCTGCTCVFNKSLLQILKKGTPNIIVMHDDWVHKVCLAVGGTVYYDEYRSLKYRQHGGNVDGGVHGIKQKITQIMKRMRNHDRIRSEQLKEIVRLYADDIALSDLRKIQFVAGYREYSLFSRIKKIVSLKIKTPYGRLNRGFYAAILFKYF